MGTERVPVVWCPDIRRVISSSSFKNDGNLGASNINGEVTVWDIGTNYSISQHRCIFNRAGFKPSITDLSITADGRLVASVHVDGKLRLWDAASYMTDRASSMRFNNANDNDGNSTSSSGAVAGRGGGLARFSFCRPDEHSDRITCLLWNRYGSLVIT